MSEPEDSKTDMRSPDETAVRPVESRPGPTERFTPGTLLAGRYRIISPLGKGGMGEVYRADDIRLGQPVALKFLPGALAADPGRLEKLVDEVRIGRQISHPNVCRLYDIAEADGHHFLVMEYVDGEDLASLLRRIGPISGIKALEIARGMCAGLAAAHEKGIIHRDLKPANVMIDGRGHARIADFGLAALAQGGEARDMSGTPQYMAPEQLTGAGASTRSDVYALGLVLHEMLTGKRVFEAKSLGELRALHAETKPPSLSISATDVDPTLDRVIHRCLARDPADRPASAREVLLALPGGDPLQAALLAGETPSPEMVAAAGKVGDLRAGVAWACLVAGLFGLWATTAFSGRVSIYRQVSLPKSPEVLRERAKEILGRLGVTAPVADTAAGFIFDAVLGRHFMDNDPSLDRRRRLTEARPGVFRFYYRTSPRELVPNGWIPVLPWLGPPELGRVTHDTPALVVPGMTDVVIDPAGNLVSFTAVPPRTETDAGPFPDPDWSVLLREANLDPARLTMAPSTWSGPVESDRKAAWDGTFEDRPDAQVHIEAAAQHGRPVYFEIQGDWVKAPSNARTTSRALSTATTVIFLVTPAILIALILLVRRNFRMGRGDRRGAMRLALASFSVLTLAQAIRADHTTLPIEEYTLLVHIMSQGCYAALAMWAFYIALEPAVRRRWPHTLIAWTRVMGGRFTDPLVARDTLVGLVFGLALILVIQIAVEAPLWVGRPPSFTASGVLVSLNSPKHVVYNLLLGPLLGVLYSLSMLFMLYLARAFTARDWAARSLVFMFVFALSFANADDPWIDVPVATVFSSLVIIGLTRFGLWCSAVFLATFFLLVRAPLILDWSSWYAGRSFAVLGLLAGLLFTSAYLSLGGKPLFGKALLDD